jgi:hypothetical protein
MRVFKFKTDEEFVTTEARGTYVISDHTHSLGEKRMIVSDDRR